MFYQKEIVEKNKSSVLRKKNIFITNKMLLSCLELESYNLRPEADLLYPYVLKSVDIIVTERKCKAAAI